jgi:hypothetical protein
MKDLHKVYSKDEDVEKYFNDWLTAIKNNES